MSTATFEGKKDYSAEVQAAIPESLSIAQQRGIDEAVNFLLPLEKKCRVNNDFLSLKEVSLQLVRLCRGLNEWEKLNAVLALINKRSANQKSTLSAVVSEGMGYLDSTPSLEVKIALIKALKDVCEGKLFVEGESAHLHFMLAAIYESQGQIGDACDTIQDVHVETYGSLTKNEKATYILQQIRLNLVRKDFIRTAIHSRKMNLKTIEEDGFESIKVQFYTLQIEFHTHEQNTFEICQAYEKIATTKQGDALDSVTTKYALEAAILFVLMSKHSDAQQVLLKKLHASLSKEHKSVQLSHAFQHVLTLFTTSEIIVSPFDGQAELETHESLRRFCTAQPEVTQAFVHLLRKRIIEHNLRVVSKYYKQITLRRLQQLTNLSSDQLEERLSELSFEGDIFLKIDRPAGIVCFQSKRSSEQILTAWSADISKLLSLMESTSHLINRETMVHKL